MSEFSLEVLPGGIPTMSGGTRRGVKLDRSWQSDIIVNPGRCPFEDEESLEGRLIRFYQEEGGWRVITNQFTPYHNHLLIMPMTCWSKEDLRTLGGLNKITVALRIVSDILAPIAGERWLNVYVGATAGQNVTHLHYHLLEPAQRILSRPERDVAGHFASSLLVLFELEGFRVVVGGHRAGQCFIVPLEGRPFDQSAAESLAGVLQRIIRMFAEKFTSSQGLPPDFQINVKFIKGRVVYACFIPILNNWGGTEYLALMEGTPITLPWPHEDTLGHLLGR
ncbi:MAG: hypothetical protein HY983_00380 [Candidatus Magasanikbacteria bacterium]|nr:hypothetical protein [Candidatus Magasanikbacteria bacterium]